MTKVGIFITIRNLVLEAMDSVSAEKMPFLHRTTNNALDEELFEFEAAGAAMGARSETRTESVLTDCLVQSKLFTRQDVLKLVSVLAKALPLASKFQVI